MSTQHIVHKVLEPGLPGDGFTAPEAANARAAIARVDPGTAGVPNMVLVHGPSGPRWVPGIINAVTYGMSPSNTAAQNKAALEAAIDASPNLTTIYIPRGYYLIENLKQYGRSISLIGDGRGQPNAQGPYGLAAYSSMGSTLGGTTLAVTSTTGNFLDVNIPGIYGNCVNLEKISIVGIGDATRTNTAVMMGADAAPMRWPANCFWKDVLICNFYRGAMIEHMQWGHWSGVYFHGCRQAAHLANQCNQNTFAQTLIASCGGAGVVMFDVERSELNTFGSMTFQTNNSGVVFRLRDYSLNNHIGDIYAEDPSGHAAVPAPITRAIEVTANCSSNIFDMVQLMKPEDTVLVSGAGNKMTIGDRSMAAITDNGSDNRWDIYNTVASPITTNWPGNVRTRQAPKSVGAGSYTPTLTDSAIFADAGAGTVTINLPPVATQNGRRLVISKVNSGGSVLIDPSGSELIDTGSNASLTVQLSSREIMCDGIRWRTIASHL